MKPKPLKLIFIFSHALFLKSIARLVLAVIAVPFAFPSWSDSASNAQMVMPSIPTPPTPSNWQQQESVHLRYEVSGQTHHFPFNFPGEIVLQLSQPHYKAKFEISHILLGTRTQISEGEFLVSTGVVPDRFVDKIKSEDSVVFNRANNLLEFTSKVTPEPLEPFAQDQLSVIFQLGYWIASHLGQLPLGGSTTIQLVSKKNVEVRNYEFMGSEILNLPIGRIEAFKIIRVPRSSNDQRATVWLVKNNGLNLARLLLEEQNGDFIDQKLCGLELITGLKLSD